MAVEKALYQLPEAPVDFENEAVEIVLVDDDYGMEEAPEEIPHDANLADYIEDGDLKKIGSDIISMFQADKRSRSAWEKAYQDGLKLLGLSIEDRTEPWPGACGVFHPLLMESVVRFQSHAIMETFPPSGPVKTKVIGKLTPDREKQASRVREDMNYIITEEMPEYRNEHERMLFNLPLAGSAFKKVWFNPVTNRPVAEFLSAEDVYVPYGSTDLKSASRIIHKMKEEANEIRKRMQAGFYRDLEIQDAPDVEYSSTEMAEDEVAGVAPTLEEDTRHTIYEAHLDIIIPGIGEGEPEETIARPHVVSVLGDGRVLAVRRNWDEGDPFKLPRCHFVHYFYLPGLGFYGIGLIHLLGGIAKSATSILRQLVDAGTLSNLPGGFKSRDLRVKGENHPIKPGEFRDVDVSGDEIRKSILPLPFKEPSTVLFQLLGQLAAEGRRIGSIADVDIASAGKDTPVGTVLALMERSMKIMSAVQARLHASMGRELKMLAVLVKKFMEPDYPFETDPGTSRATDYDERVDVIPVSDPNASTMAQKVVQYQAAMQASAGAPGIYDMKELHRGMLDVMEIRNAEKIIPMDVDMKPKDPVAENMAILGQEPVKAFEHQDHESHIQVHMSMAQDPRVLELVGQSPNAASIQGALAAHVTEHIAYAYKRRIEKELGAALPAMDEDISPETEASMAPMIAEAAQRVLQQGFQQKQEEKNKQAQDDPVVQLQQREVALKERKQEFDEWLKKEEIAIDRMRVASGERIAGAKIGAGYAQSKEELSSKERIEGMKGGVKMMEKLSDEKLSDTGNSESITGPAG